MVNGVIFSINNEWDSNCYTNTSHASTSIHCFEPSMKKAYIKPLLSIYWLHKKMTVYIWLYWSYLTTRRNPRCWTNTHSLTVDWWDVLIHARRRGAMHIQGYLLRHLIMKARRRHVSCRRGRKSSARSARNILSHRWHEYVWIGSTPCYSIIKHFHVWLITERSRLNKTKSSSDAMNGKAAWSVLPHSGREGEIGLSIRRARPTKTWIYIC
jgi:hypothetical protein